MTWISWHHVLASRSRQLEHNTLENNQSFTCIYAARTPTEHNAPDNIQREIMTLRVEYSTVQHFCWEMEVYSSLEDPLAQGYSPHIVYVKSKVIFSNYSITFVTCFLFFSFLFTKMRSHIPLISIASEIALQFVFICNLHMLLLQFLHSSVSLVWLSIAWGEKRLKNVMCSITHLKRTVWILWNDQL